MVEQLFLAVPRGCLQFVIVVFPDHTHLLFMAFVLGTWCITVMFPKLQMPYKILKSCTVSYYSRIDVAKGADRMATIVQPMCAQCLNCQKTYDSANYSVFLIYMYEGLDGV